MLSKDNKFHRRTKHIDVWYEFTCEADAVQNVVAEYITTEDNIAAVFMKATMDTVLISHEANGTTTAVSGRARGEVLKN